MIIGIDGNEANVERKVGISEYAFELLKQFENFQFPRLAAKQAISNFQFQIYLKNTPREDLPKEKKGWKYRVVKPTKLWTQIGLPLNLFINKPRPDVFLSLTHYAPRFCPVPTIVSIMDLSYILYPEMFKKNDLYQLKNWTSYSVKNASKVITISKSSKDDIIKYYKVSNDKVEVVYPGIKFKMQNSKFIPIQSGQNSKLLKEKYGIEGQYILFVGTLQPRKNIERLIEAFSQISNIKNQRSKTEYKSLKLIIIGKKGWLYEPILEAPKKFGIEERVKFLDYVSDQDLPEFYENALCFVLPSLYEGFGLPILEAMKYGSPVLTSNVSSLPEAGGDAAVYFNPLDVNDIFAKIKKVLDDKNMREQMIKKGFEQVKKFSWEKAAKEILKVIEEVGKDKLKVENCPDGITFMRDPD